jgi:hypothetical protein
VNLIYKQKGLTTLTVILLVALVFVTAGLGYVGYAKWSGDSRDKEELNVFSEDVPVTHQTSKYVRGEKVVDGEVFPVFYIFEDGQWQEVKLLGGVILCEKMIKLGFPASFVSDCILEYPKAQTVAEAIDEISVGGSKEIEIIGEIGVGKDPSCSSCFNINSGGGDIDLDLGDINFSDDINPGDTVYVELDVLDDEVVVVNVDKVNDLDEEDDEKDNDDDEGGLEDGVYYDITNLPPGVSKEDYYRWLYDIDNSDVEIQVIQDF